MPRIAPIHPETASPAAAELLTAVKKKMGVVPNIIATMAQSTSVANAYLGFSQSLAGGLLSPRLREQIALAVGEANECQYCVAAHSMLGKKAGLTEADTEAARRGSATDAKEARALEFARAVVAQRGHVADADVQELRNAGYSDGEIVEIVAHVALNLFTNYFNHVADTEIDFPAAPELART